MTLRIEGIQPNRSDHLRETTRTAPRENFVSPQFTLDQYRAMEHLRKFSTNERRGLPIICPDPGEARTRIRCLFTV